MVIKENFRWIPFRLRMCVERLRITFALRGLNRTRPIPAASADRAHAEVHMLLCKKDLIMGVLALKSLLRFDDVKFAVTITNDGSLSRRDQQWLGQHIPGVRWLGWPVMDRGFRDRLSHYPRLKGLYQEKFIFSSLLLHPIFLGRCKRVIRLDADTAFFSEPRQLLEWALGDDAHPLYLHDSRQETSVPSEVKEAFERLRERLAQNERVWSLEHSYFNGGLLAYRPEQMDLSLAEGYLEWLAGISCENKTGRSAIWFGDWVREQTCYMIMFAYYQQGAEALGEAYHIGDDAGYVFNHFLGGSTLCLQRELIEQIRKI